MTSSPHSFAYSYRLVKKCFLKIRETSKCHNFLIFQPIFIRFSLLCLKIFTLSSEIKLNRLWSSSLRGERGVFPLHGLLCGLWFEVVDLTLILGVKNVQENWLDLLQKCQDIKSCSTHRAEIFDMPSLLCRMFSTRSRDICLRNYRSDY